jgi:hypothetical protein
MKNPLFRKIRITAMEKKYNQYSVFAFIMIFMAGMGLFQPVKTMVTVPTEDSMAAALKEALSVGTGKAVSFLNQPGGYLNNAQFKIPFPPEAEKVETKMRQIGMGSQVDKFVTTMNQAAENAAAEAKPIFVNAVQQMTLTDAKNILLGADNSATVYFKDKTYSGLTSAFSPKIKTALDATSATKYWSEIITKYNKIPMVKKMNPDLVSYTTGKALDGLFLKLSQEEKDIRSSTAARPTELLKNVFGWADKMKH